MNHMFPLYAKAPRRPLRLPARPTPPPGWKPPGEGLPSLAEIDMGLELAVRAETDVAAALILTKLFRDQDPDDIDAVFHAVRHPRRARRERTAPA